MNVQNKGEVIPSAVCVSDFRAPKVLYCIFFDGLGPVAQIPVPKGQTLTGQFYADVVLPEVEKFYLLSECKTHKSLACESRMYARSSTIYSPM